MGRIDINFDEEKFKRDWKDGDISKKSLEFIYNRCYKTLRKIANNLNLGNRNRKSGRPVGWRKNKEGQCQIKKTMIKEVSGL